MPLNNEKNFDERPHRYELIDKDGGIVVNGRWLCTDCDSHFAVLDKSNRCGCGSGRVIGKGFDTAVEAADWARRWWPDQQQDPDRTGVGWDIQVAGASQ